MKKQILSCFMAVMLLAGFTPIRTMAEDLLENGKFIYVRNDGDDINTGTDESEPYLTLAKAVTAAESGDTIIVLSNLEMEACARFYDKEITIKSGDGGPYTVTRGENFATQSDPARLEYNPAMIEVNGTEILDNDGIGTGEFNKSALRLENIILDDNGITEGSYFEYASTDTTGKLASGRFNYELVQDAVVATYNGVGTITLGEGTEIKNFGGMTAVFITGDGCLIMESGSRIYDDTTLFTIEKPAPTGMVRREKQSLSAVHFVSGGKLDMQEGSEIKNLRNACAFNLDGTDADKGDIVINGECDLDYFSHMVEYINLITNNFYEE